MLTVREMLGRADGWSPPDDWLRVTTIDAHTAGEPLRVVTGGYPVLVGQTILERRRHARESLDRLRTILMWEPRGHADMYGAVLTEPVSEDADLGVVFLHNEGYSTMCGHGVIAIAMIAVETGMVPRTGVETRVAMDTPAGLTVAFVGGARSGEVRFRNVPSFVVALDQEVEAPTLGPVSYDLAFGGAFYAYVDAGSVGLTCEQSKTRQLIEAGMEIKRAVAESAAPTHPFQDEASFLYGTIFIGPSEQSEAHSRNVCVFADGEVDRSPTGTGVSGRAAIHHARGEIETGERIRIESILGTEFGVRVVDTVRFGPYEAVIPEVTGRAFITGRHELLVDPADVFAEGFFLR